MLAPDIFRRSLPLLVIITALVPTARAFATDGQWSNPAGGLWSDPNNWLSRTIADGDVADFSTLPLPADATVHLDSPRSAHTFFIADTTSTHNWHFDNNNSANNTLTLVGPTATSFSVGNGTAFFDLTLTGAVGLFKDGLGTLVIQQPATYTGKTTVFFGQIVSGVDNALPATTDLQVVALTTFDLNGHSQQLASITGVGTVTNSAPGIAADLIISPLNTNTIVTSITGNLNLNKENSTTLFIAITPTYTGLTSIDAGTLFFNANASLHEVDGVGNLTIGAGISLTSDSVQLPTVHVTAGGTYTIRPNGTNLDTSFLRTLTLDGTTDAWTSTFDLTNNKLILVPSSNRTAALADLRNQAIFGRTHATGLHASGLPGNEVLAVIDNALAGKTSFGGMSANANSILIGPELLGDLNLDGKVNATDLSALLNNFGSTLPDWSSGNFDGAPTIDLTDLADLLNNFGASIPGPTLDRPSIANSPSSAVAPEPASLALLLPVCLFRPRPRRDPSLQSPA